MAFPLTIVQPPVEAKFPAPPYFGFPEIIAIKQFVILFFSDIKFFKSFSVDYSCFNKLSAEIIPDNRKFKLFFEWCFFDDSYRTLRLIDNTQSNNYSGHNYGRR